tara:strand:- start:85 stop:330 length:246 start_codon:yes stop_codon:yes gene_type:complete
MNHNLNENRNKKKVFYFYLLAIHIVIIIIKNKKNLVQRERKKILFCKTKRQTYVSKRMEACGPTPPITAINGPAAVAIIPN